MEKTWQTECDQKPVIGIHPARGVEYNAHEWKLWENDMSNNLADLSKEEMDKVNVDLAASSIAFKERYNMPMVAEMAERQQPEHLRPYFRERVAHYRAESHKFSRLPFEPKQK